MSRDEVGTVPTPSPVGAICRRRDLGGGDRRRCGHAARASCSGLAVRARVERASRVNRPTGVSARATRLNPRDLAKAAGEERQLIWTKHAGCHGQRPRCRLPATPSQPVIIPPAPSRASERPLDGVTRARASGATCAYRDGSRTRTSIRSHEPRRRHRRPRRRARPPRRSCDSATADVIDSPKNHTRYIPNAACSSFLLDEATVEDIVCLAISSTVRQGPG